ncbi:hypothetical protein ElyMa_002552900 [Elysia marginata]|uniref:Uncharacterized protein n=1 Tax=Elysia marginata TaxID=1093978 RepID=A0AAV4GWD7_9GAST|nr:hypothetical protein ElyMa_002552900 [Elysia marginata]
MVASTKRSTRSSHFMPLVVVVVVVAVVVIVVLVEAAAAAVVAIVGQRGGVVSASDSRSGGPGFDSRPRHVAIALGKQFTLTFPSPPTCKMGIQLQASNVLVCWDISGAALWRHSYVE